MPEDRDLVSTQTHELNYLLQKWDKKQSRKNRDILRDVIRDFKDDTSFKPHIREIFYKYVDEYDILQLLEDKDKKDTGRKPILPDIDTGELTIDDPLVLKEKKRKAKIKKIKKPKISLNEFTKYKNNKIDVKTSGKRTGSKKKLFIIILVVALAVIFLTILIGVGTCFIKNTQTAKTDLSSDTDTSLPGIADDDKKTDETAVFTHDSLQNFLKTCTPIYFKGDLDVLMPGEDKKITEFALYLDNYSAVGLFIEGHTASIGHPDDEMELSKKRAQHIISLLKRKTKNVTLEVNSIGYGAARPAVKNPDKKQMRLNRRVEISVIDAE